MIIYQIGLEQILYALWFFGILGCLIRFGYALWRHDLESDIYENTSHKQTFNSYEILERNNESLKKQKVTKPKNYTFKKLAVIATIIFTLIYSYQPKHMDTQNQTSQIIESVKSGNIVDNILSKVEGFIDGQINDFKDSPFKTGIKIYVVYYILKKVYNYKK